MIVPQVQKINPEESEPTPPPPSLQGLDIWEKLLWKYEETLHVGT